MFCQFFFTRFGRLLEGREPILTQESKTVRVFWPFFSVCRFCPWIFFLRLVEQVLYYKHFGLCYGRGSGTLPLYLDQVVLDLMTRGPLSCLWVHMIEICLPY